MQGLLDHDSVTLLLVIVDLGDSGNRGRKSSYFKMDPDILKDKENIRALEEVWRCHDEGITDPRRRFVFAYGRMRTKCKEIQGLRKLSDSFKTMLQEELRMLTLELEHEDHEESILEWEALKANLFELECDKVALWQHRSTNRWLANGNEPSPFFFGLTEEKQRRELILSMNNVEG